MVVCLSLEISLLGRGSYRLTASRRRSRNFFEFRCSRRPEIKQGEDKGNNHNPKRQRGIYRDTCKARQLNLSLTFRIGMT